MGGGNNGFKIDFLNVLVRNYIFIKTQNMKKLTLLILIIGCATGVFAQSNTTEKTLFERVSKVEKKIDWFNLYLNMQGSFDASFNYDRIRIE